MNKRQESKTKTRALIIQTARIIFIEKGFLATTTSDIAERCDLAHGSIFLHFGTKENLIASVLDHDLRRMAEYLDAQCLGISQIEKLLDKYFDFVESEEPFLSAMYREMPFFSDNLKRKIISLESMVRNSFYLALEQAGRDHIYITAALTSLFATLYYYLCLKDIFTTEQSVIRQKRHEIKAVFLKTIQ